MLPLAATTCALLLFNWYPSQVGASPRHFSQMCLFPQAQRHPFQTCLFPQAQRHPSQTCLFPQAQRHPSQTCLFPQAQRHPFQVCLFPQAHPVIWQLDVRPPVCQLVQLLRLDPQALTRLDPAHAAAGGFVSVADCHHDMVVYRFLIGTN